MIANGHSLYTGTVTHSRLTPKRHRFQYRLSLLCLDLDDLDRAFRGRWLWSLEKPNIASYRRNDYLPGGHPDLAEAARDVVQKASGARPSGRVMLLAQPRYFGFCFNPISLFFCHDYMDRLRYVIAEVHNTPWNERHPYVLTIPGTTRRKVTVDFDKALHVSPFMDMDMRYRLHLAESEGRLNIGLENRHGSKRIFSAGMQLQARPLTASACAYALTATPMLTLKTFAAIYWQALRLWLKGVPFIAHPGGNSIGNPKQTEKHL